MAVKNRAVRRRRRNVPSWVAPVSIVGGVVVLGGLAYGIMNWVLGNGVREIPDGAIPPAYPPGVGASGPSLGSPINLGLVDLGTLFDPKIVVLRPGGSVRLLALDWHEPDGSTFKTNGWVAPERGDEYTGDATAEPFLEANKVGLFNIGGPGAKRLRRSIKGVGIDDGNDLVIQAPSDWTKDDWAQIRLYRADVTLSPPANDEIGSRYAEQVQIRTDLEPIQIVWIMGAY